MVGIIASFIPAWTTYTLDRNRTGAYLQIKSINPAINLGAVEGDGLLYKMHLKNAGNAMASGIRMATGHQVIGSPRWDRLEQSLNNNDYLRPKELAPNEELDLDFHLGLSDLVTERPSWSDSELKASVYGVIEFWDQALQKPMRIYWCYYDDANWHDPIPCRSGISVTKKNGHP